MNRTKLRVCFMLYIAIWGCKEHISRTLNSYKKRETIADWKQKIICDKKLQLKLFCYLRGLFRFNVMLESSFLKAVWYFERCERIQTSLDPRLMLRFKIFTNFYYVVQPLDTLKFRRHMQMTSIYWKDMKSMKKININ